MAARLLALSLLTVVLMPAAPKKTVATAKGENEDLILTVTMYIDPAGVKQLIGSDLDGHFLVADVKVEPKYGKEISIDRDDFQLRTDKDGEKSKPMAPSQIAGRGALIVNQSAAARSSGGVSLGSPTGDDYPIGYPGGYPGGYPPMGAPPVMMPGGAMGGTGGEADNGDAAATTRSSARDKENPLEKVLETKILPEKKADKPVTGLLYFAMEKQKMKDLELYYGGKDNRISLRFK